MGALNDCPSYPPGEWGFRWRSPAPCVRGAVQVILSAVVLAWAVAPHYPARLSPARHTSFNSSCRFAMPRCAPGLGSTPRTCNASSCCKRAARPPALREQRGSAPAFRFAQRIAAPRLRIVDSSRSAHVLVAGEHHRALSHTASPRVPFGGRTSAVCSRLGTRCDCVGVRHPTMRPAPPRPCSAMSSPGRRAARAGSQRPLPLADGHPFHEACPCHNSP